MLKFFYAARTCSLASHIALEEAGAVYQAVPVDLAGGEQRTADYLAINPLGRVPVLVTDRGVLTESPAILAFIAQSYPEAGLAPLDDPFAFACVQAFNSYLCSTVHVAQSHFRRGARWADDPAAIAEMKRKAPQVVADCFEMIEHEKFAGPWVTGEHYSICDPYLFSMAQWLESDAIDVTRFPRIAEHRQRMSERPAVKKVLAALHA
ncbi:glutathione S-transferase family protein [Telmatospirillum sp.]|uniref:glutathione S-transferase family protein n=1 Tax=Telmatospirillum sp. TaxID=2079197 RepID=UPI002849A245|nr:glutathione S-transferase family protein [Telmatospirillum sp.]MDR3437779.1 glutathione S-transferase family protein [Telmatospirillum sp.]